MQNRTAIQNLAIGLLQLGAAAVLAPLVGILLGTAALLPLLPVGAVLYVLGWLALLSGSGRE